MMAIQKSWKWSLSRIVCCVALGVGTDAMGTEKPLQRTGPGTNKENPIAPIVSDQSKATGKAPAGNTPQGKIEKSGSPFAALPGASPARGLPAVSEPLKLKVFRLQHANPQGVGGTAWLILSGQYANSRLLGQVFGMAGGPAPLSAVQQAATQLGGVGGLGIGGGFGQFGGPMPGGGFGLAGGPMPGGAGIAGIGGGFGGGIGGIPGMGGFQGMVAGAGIMGMHGGMPGAGATTTRFAFDERTRTLMVRGQERDLRIVADLVAVLDAAPGNPAPQVKHVSVFRLKHADPQQVALAVMQLGIEARVAPVEEGDFHPEVKEDQRFLFAIGSEEQIGEIRQVVEAMDMQVNNAEENAPAPAPRKKGGKKGGKKGRAGQPEE